MRSARDAPVFVSGIPVRRRDGHVVCACRVGARHVRRHLSRVTIDAFGVRAFPAQTRPATAQTRRARRDEIYVADGWVILFSPHRKCR
ncbi:hypothetical protein LUTEI9C_10306 [Luteimonas sp. 9C]|nr:hypothetical protein LUTEI9C_10306 [Luteimonas sp. 9C]